MFEEKKEGLFDVQLKQDAVIYLHVVDLGVRVLDFSRRTGTYPRLLVRELHSADEELADHIARHQPELVAVDMYRLNFVNGKVRVGFVKGLAIGSAGEDLHPETEEHEVIAFISR